MHISLYILSAFIVCLALVYHKTPKTIEGFVVCGLAALIYPVTVAAGLFGVAAWLFWKYIIDPVVILIGKSEDLENTQ